MSWSDAVDNAMDAWFDTDEMAQTITYAGTEITADVMYGGKSTHAGPAKTAVIEVKVADVAQPAYRDAVVIGGNTWTVYRDRMQQVEIEGDGYTWKIPVKRDERPDFK